MEKHAKNSIKQTDSAQKQEKDGRMKAQRRTPIPPLHFLCLFLVFSQNSRAFAAAWEVTRFGRRL